MRQHVSFILKKYVIRCLAVHGTLPILTKWVAKWQIIFTFGHHSHSSSDMETPVWIVSFIRRGWLKPILTLVHIRVSLTSSYIHTCKLMRGEKGNNGERGASGYFFWVSTPHPRCLMTPQSFYNYGLLIVLTANLNNNNHFKKKRSSE